ncbi:hypothetical protein CAB88_13305 [Bacillus thuringiensis]|uniref:Uncharacterized protein n=2 Tax=Bacillus thuringiensis TaxID=1428 RepID=A0AAP4Q5S1_BACTU|nr:hypothetical protein CAB88_13305 [Bacillus thuringiensis]OTW37388.1 hypothetical protein BK698_33025 [Bacillus thuringiensis serovar thuringiensis]PQZ69003.1 hypothetical protein CQ064_29970 [Bacillus sp. MYb78]AST04769.1 hypothetical protein BT10792_05425 [Bacillus thuringiensis]MBN6705113.1 hypothetical protein [Bacillus thuringiensis]
MNRRQHKSYKKTIYSQSEIIHPFSINVQTNPIQKNISFFNEDLLQIELVDHWDVFTLPFRI